MRRSYSLNPIAEREWYRRAASTPLPKTQREWRQFSSINPLMRIYHVIGAQGTRIPAKLHGDFEIDGWVVRVLPAHGKRRRHRVLVNLGGRFVPAGRVSQAVVREPPDRLSRTCSRVLALGEYAERAYEEAHAFGAPSECMGPINRSIGEEIADVLHEAGYTVATFLEAVTERTNEKFCHFTFDWIESYFQDERKAG